MKNTIRDIGYLLADLGGGVLLASNQTGAAKMGWTTAGIGAALIIGALVSEYNRVAQRYNERTRRFSWNIVARIHNFKELYYLTFEGQPAFEPREIFNDEP